MKKILFFLLTGFLFNVFAQEIVIKNPWVRAVPPTAKNSALFMIIQNNSDKTDVLKTVKSDVCKMVMIHRTVKQGDIMKMVHVHELQIPPRSKVALKPGSYHIMLMGLKRPLKVGEILEFKLIFKNAGEITVKAPVKMK
ncbi:copper chaperone PCu(A)C [Persephonella sp.]